MIINLVWFLEIPLVCAELSSTIMETCSVIQAAPFKANMPLFSLEKTAFEKAT
jgi:hypothetical protein